MRERRLTDRLAVLAAWLLSSACVYAAPPIAGTPHKGNTAEAPAAPAVASPFTPEQADTLTQANAAFERGAYAQALTLLRKLRDDRPDFVDVHRLMGHCYYELGRIDEARAAMIESITRGRATADVLQRLVQIDREADRPLAELGSLRMLMLIQPDDRQTQMLYADALTRAGAIDEAAGAFERIIAADPLNTDARVRLGNLQMQRGERRQAAAVFATAYRLGAESPQLAQTIAELWVSFGDARQALAWYDKAASLTEPLSARRQLRRAELLIEVGDIDQAIKLATPIANAGDKELAAKAATLLGRAAIVRGQPDEAMAQWRVAIDKGVDDPQVLAYVGGQCFNAKRYDDAARYLGRYVDKGVANPSMHRFLVIALTRSDQRDAAHERLRGYIERYGLDEIAEDLIRQWGAAGHAKGAE